MFGRKKMYKQGMADALKANEDFSKKQEEALNFMREEVRAGNKSIEQALNDTMTKLKTELGANINDLYKYLNSKEKAALYHLSTPYELKDLRNEDKQLLLAALIALANRQESEGATPTPFQQSYIRSVKNYLGIANPQELCDDDLFAVGNIDSLDIQKAFIQVALEYFYLQDSEELTASQKDFLSYFSLKESAVELIDMRVGSLYCAVGPEGIAEKYDTGLEENTDGESKCLRIGEKQECVLDKKSEIEVAKKFKALLQNEDNLFWIVTSLESSVSDMSYNDDDIHSKADAERKAIARFSTIYGEANRYLSEYYDDGFVQTAVSGLFPRVKTILIEALDEVNSLPEEIKAKNAVKIEELRKLLDANAVKQQITDIAKKEINDSYYQFPEKSNYTEQIEYESFEHDPPGLFGKKDWWFDGMNAYEELCEDLEKRANDYSAFMSKSFRREVIKPITDLIDSIVFQ